MSCYFPLKAYKGKSEDAQKIKIVFKRPESWKGEPISLPCGQCIGCRLERSRQWAVRCMHEASLYEENSFITLTYEDKYLPKDGSLCLDHFQRFMKRLRKENEKKKIRFIHCGEYGEERQRPHYHSLLFNHDFEDKKYFTKSGENNLYVSESLQRLWPYGFSTIGEVTFESAAYVARYAMKKVTGSNAETHYGLRRPEYITMSRRPGIGTDWYKTFKSDVYPHDRVVVRGNFTRPPRFYDDLLGREDPSSLALLKIKREKNSLRMVEDVLSSGKVIKVSDVDSFRLKVKEEVKRDQIKNLKRSLGE